MEVFQKLTEERRLILLENYKKDFDFNIDIYELDNTADSVLLDPKQCEELEAVFDFMNQHNICLEEIEDYLYIYQEKGFYFNVMPVITEVPYGL